MHHVHPSVYLFLKLVNNYAFTKVEFKYCNIVSKFHEGNLWMEVKLYRIIAAALTHETSFCVLTEHFIEPVAPLID